MQTELKEWMEKSLYDPEYGFYSKNVASMSDYVTAPNFGPYIGWAISRELADLINARYHVFDKEVFTLVEVACASDASLALAILENWKKENLDLFNRTQVILVDKSLPRLTAATKALSSVYPGKIFSCPDINEIPKIKGAIISNELLDSFPVHIVRRTDARAEIAYIEVGGSNKKSISWKKCDDPEIATYAFDLPLNLPYALNLDAFSFIETAANKLDTGVLLTMDYGDVRPKLFTRSPLKAFSKGQVKFPDLNSIGKEDLTSPVDFDLLMDVGESSGFENIYYENLGAFLLKNNIKELWKDSQVLENIKENLKIKAMFHPLGFGNDFKVLIQGK
ncbi:SAM-dependent methyltransferase [Elusimicrobiota bacterium]